MKMNELKKNLALTLTLAFSMTSLGTPVHAQDGALIPPTTKPTLTIPSAKVWSATWLKDSASAKQDKYFSEHVVFVEELPAKGCPRFMVLDSKGFSSESFFTAADSEDLSWLYALNKDRLSCNKAKRGEAEVSKEIMALGEADTIVVKGDDEWDFFALRQGKVEKVYAFAGPVGEDGSIGEELADWFGKAVGFDGVVLDRKGDFALVKTGAQYLKPKAQALVIESSQQVYGFSQEARKGSAIMQLVSASGEYGVFKVVVYGKEKADFSYGTKLIMQK